MFAEDIAKLESEMSTNGESSAAITTFESIKDMKAALVNHKEVQKYREILLLCGADTREELADKCKDALEKTKELVVTLRKILVDLGKITIAKIE
jgi:hypothetical protein